MSVLSGVAMAALVVGVCEMVWSRVSVLREYRWHFRAMLVLFWAAALLVAAVEASGLVPEVFHQGAPRFASDAVVNREASFKLAASLRSGAMAALFTGEQFLYVRVLGLVHAVFGSYTFTGNVFHALFYLTSLACVFLVGRRLFGAGVAIIGTWALACWPTFLLHHTQTLRWGMTTAALHLAVVGTLTLSSCSWYLALPLAVLGFSVLLQDLPYVARVYPIAVIMFGIAVLADRPAGRARLVVAGRLFAFAAISSLGFHLSWNLPVTPAGPPATPPMSQVGSVEPRASEPAPTGAVSEAARARRRWIGAAYTTFVTRLDAAVEPAVRARAGFINEAEDLRRAGIPVGTAIEGPHLATVADIVKNLPAAYALALSEPTPDKLLRVGGGSTRLRHFAIVEMLAYYLVLLMTPIGIVLALRTRTWIRTQSLFIVVLLAGMYAMLGTVVLNGGTLLRLRQPYAAFHLVFAAAATSWLRPWIVAKLRRRWIDHAPATAAQ